MIGIADFIKTEYINLEPANPPKHNKIWGNDFLLMDSDTFMGGADGSEYENIIEMFVNIWNLNENEIR